MASAAPASPVTVSTAAKSCGFATLAKGALITALALVAIAVVAHQLGFVVNKYISYGTINKLWVNAPVFALASASLFAIAWKSRNDCKA